MDKILLEYENCQCSKIEKRVTITSMRVADLNESAIPHETEDLAFDCDKKGTCGVLTVLGKTKSVNWSECVHPKLSEAAENKNGLGGMNIRRIGQEKIIARTGGN